MPPAPPKLQRRASRLNLPVSSHPFLLLQQDQDVQVRSVFDLKLWNFQELIEEITDQARQELKMEKTLEKIEAFWSSVVFDTLPHKQTDVKLLKINDATVETLEEHQMLVQNMFASRYKTIIRPL
eukprot:GHVT01099748.1.p2 GENE.GHVT01099748.1~~GHVT01099748.1.p2  ORF type:complete len:125 (+),score=20.92 GHVT01099748.1:276-650(+)